MRVSYQWLQEYVDLNGISPEELAERLTLAGIEVEAIERLGQDIDKVVVGYVLEREKHPNADRLSVCRVDVGTDEVLQIVCGAPNVAAGQKVPVALIGARLPGGVKIKKSKLRGVESQGMICSAAELGIPDRLLRKDQTEGILVLPEEAEVGQSAVSFLGLDDVVLELALTPNRADCLSMIGVAYEVAAILDRPVKLPTVSLQETDRPIRFPVRVEAPDACWRYAGRVIRNVRIAPSPQWLQNRLMAAGMRPINNVVDITNYVMLEYGQPLHAFDADRIETGEIVVRKARPGERLVTLDDVERELDEEMLLITDGNQPIGLAGVMGGANSAITPATRVVLLESAWFDPRRVRVTARRHGLLSEAAQRFEKGVDPAAVERASARAMALLAAVGAGRPLPGAAVVRTRRFPPRRLPWRPQRLRQWLGVDLDDATLAGSLQRLGFRVDAAAGAVDVPSYRTDIEGEVDLAEEVGRVYGLDRIPAELPAGRPAGDEVSPRLRLTWQAREALAQAGAQEVVSWAFTRPQAWDALRLPPDHPWRRAIPLLHPLAEEHSLLRTTLLPGLLDVLAYNARRQQPGALVYEVGAVFVPEALPLADLPEEPVRIGVAGYGELGGLHWAEPGRPVDFFTVKGVVETLLEQLGVDAAAVGWERTDEPWLHPGRAAVLEVDGRRVGWLGELHPRVAAAWDLGERPVAAELDLEALLPAVRPVPTYRPIPRFPAIRRDIAVLAPGDLPAATIAGRIRQAAGPLLEAVRLFDRYTGKPVPEGQVSLAFALVYRAADRTLTDAEVDRVHQRVREALAGMGLTLRS